MRFILYCDGDPRELGIEDSEGNWDLREFRDHIKGCTDCKYFLPLLGKDFIQDLIDDCGGVYTSKKD